MIHPCYKLGMPVPKSKDDLAQPQIHGENIILILRSKVKVIQSVMNVCDTSYNGYTLMCETKYDYVKGQKS